MLGVYDEYCIFKKGYTQGSIWSYLWNFLKVKIRNSHKTSAKIDNINNAKNIKHIDWTTLNQCDLRLQIEKKF